VLVHFGQYGYVLTVLPALAILAAHGFVGLAREAGRRRRLLWGALAGALATQALYVTASPAVDVTAPRAGSSTAERQLAAWRAAYRYRYWTHTVAGLREQEAVVRGYVDAIRRGFDPTGTVLVTELGNPRSYPWFRHAAYYLPEFTILQLRVGDFSRGYLVASETERAGAGHAPDIPLPIMARRVVWVVDHWDPTRPRPWGLREVALPHGRYLYVLDVGRRPVEHAGYRLMPEVVVARRHE
jgi:hypothetical protein